MNVKNILKVADAIENGTVQHVDFNMQEIAKFNGCGSVACIAGYALAIKNGKFSAIDTTDPLEANKNIAEAAFEAGEYLGIKRDTYDPLFFPDANGGPGDFGWFTYDELADVPKEQAVRTLRHLAATGEVDWTV